MNKLVFKLMSILTACILLLSTFGGSAAFAAENSADVINESTEITQDTILNYETDDLTLDDAIPLENINGPTINNPEIEVQPLVAPLIPLLATVTIRAGVSLLARTSTGHVVRISKHAADQAVDRKISGAMMDKALSKGTKYKDILSGERVSWNQNGDGVAVLLNKKTDEIDTVYFEDHQKLKWVKNTWQYLGDLD